MGLERVHTHSERFDSLALAMGGTAVDRPLEPEDGRSAPGYDAKARATSLGGILMATVRSRRVLVALPHPMPQHRGRVHWYGPRVVPGWRGMA